MPDAVMLFAAGFGTRMGALTKDRPKPLVTVGGTPLIEHAMRFVDEFAPSKVVANAHYHADQIVAHFAGTNVTVSVETPDILDTGGGLKNALPLLESDIVFTMNTDAVWRGPNPLQLLKDNWTDGMLALLLCVPTSNVIGHNGKGDFDIDPSGTAHWGTKYVYSGVQIIRADIVSNTPEHVFSLKNNWIDLERRGLLYAINYPGQWCDVGHPAGIELAEQMLDAPDV